jgi:hypothetical protein
MSELAERDRILGQHEAAKGGWVRLARQIASELILQWGEVSADEVRVVFEERYGRGMWGNWAGVIFKSKLYKLSGYRASKTPGAHGRVVRVWRAA